MTYMKKQYILLVTALALFSACAKDNYTEPGSLFNGRITYKGEAIGVQRNGAVYFELWQPGFGKNTAINVNLDQEGNFSAMLFNGNYKLLIPKNRGPFRSLTNAVTNSDTIPVIINGPKTMDIEVMPYYMIRNASISAKTGRVVEAKFGLDKVINDPSIARNVEKVSLYVSRTRFVDNGSQVAFKDLGGGGITDMNDIELSAVIPALTPTQSYVFGRIAVKIAGVDDQIFSKVIKIDVVD